jgi:ATP-dependent exoDNAse (exonuclease V), alpha subunit - helicase superfamily I member
VACEVARTSKSKIITMRLSPDEEFAHKVTKVSVRQDCFAGGIEDIPWEQRKPYDEFDYGYVLTVHKSQGSQWDDVVLFDEKLRISGQPRAGSIPASPVRQNGSAL